MSIHSPFPWARRYSTSVTGSFSITVILFPEHLMILNKLVEYIHFQKNRILISLIMNEASSFHTILYPSQKVAGHNPRWKFLWYVLQCSLRKSINSQHPDKTLS